MGKARLIKRVDQEAQEREQPVPVLQPSVVAVTVAKVRDWTNERRRVKPSSARQQFAELFAQPQSE